MRRSARVLVLVGTVGAVFGLAKLHALTHTYDITNSGRLGWSLAYVGVLLLAAYAVGLPSLPRSRNKLLVSAGGAALGATLMSVVTLVAGVTHRIEGPTHDQHRVLLHPDAGRHPPEHQPSRPLGDVRR